MSYSVGQIHKYSVGALQDAGGRDGPECRPAAGLQHPPRPHQGPLGRVHVLRRRRRDDRRQRQHAHPRAGEGDLAALRDRRPASARSSIPTTATSSRPTSPRRCAQGRAQLTARRSYRYTTVTAIERDGRRRVAGAHRQGRHRLRARRLLHRQLRAPDGRDGGARRPGHPRRAPVHRHRAAPRHPRAPPAGPARDGRAARGRQRPGTCARRPAASSSAPTRRARPSATSTGRTRRANTSCSRRTWSGSSRTSRPPSRACPPSAKSASRRSTTAPSPTRPTAAPSSARPGTCKNFWLNEGHSFGVTAAGGAGWQLAEWIVDGEPTVDMMGVDPRRFGPYATQRLPAREERGGLRQRLHAALSRRGAHGGAPAEDRALLRAHEGARRGVRLASMAGSGRTGSRLRATRCRRPSSNVDDVLLEREPRPGRRRRQGQGELELPPLQLLPLRRRRDQERHQRRRPAGHVALRQGASSPGPARAPGWIPSSPTASPRTAAASRCATC